MPAGALPEAWPGGTLKVRVSDASGAPVPGVDVVWSIESGEGVNITSPGLPTMPTDANGISALQAALQAGVFSGQPLPNVADASSTRKITTLRLGGETIVFDTIHVQIVP